MSSRKSGAKKGPQKYQNEVAFKHNKNSKLTRKIIAMPITGLCAKCLEMIEWRKKFRKYKPLTQPKKCVDCLERKVKEAYHVTCDDCAGRMGICAKCRQQTTIMPSTRKTVAEIEAEKRKEEAQLAMMNERQRRSYLRRLERKERGEEEEEDEEDENGEEEDENENREKEANMDQLTEKVGKVRFEDESIKEKA
ncbi:MAG: hypothetical protein DHS80DRAFT_28600 [Piptocephalis tieghemiana]|nr:MAG: hypothetical protein DHS80DRAFT_28600 [Piptocephalis tieghemiana]